MAQQPRSTTAERLRARRKQAGMANAPAHSSEAQVKSKMAELWSDAASKMSPSDVDEAWARLLEETLTPDKREALDRSYTAERNPLMRYNMLLEFSSYLRQGAAHQEGQGGDNGAGLEDDGISLTWEIGRVVIIVASVLSLVLGAAYLLGQLVDNEDPNEL